jgi:hypothetical protein
VSPSVLSTYLRRTNGKTNQFDINNNHGYDAKMQRDIENSKILIVKGYDIERTREKGFD